jgi:hypothetical protein
MIAATHHGIPQEGTLETVEHGGEAVSRGRHGRGCPASP